MGYTSASKASWKSKWTTFDQKGSYAQSGRNWLSLMWKVILTSKKLLVYKRKWRASWSSCEACLLCWWKNFLQCVFITNINLIRWNPSKKQCDFSSTNSNYLQAKDIHNLKSNINYQISKFQTNRKTISSQKTNV